MTLRTTKIIASWKPAATHIEAFDADAKSLGAVKLEENAQSVAFKTLNGATRYRLSY